jgi:hypothetical protein
MHDENDPGTGEDERAGDLVDERDRQQPESQASQPRRQPYRAPAVVTIGVLAQLMLAGTHKNPHADSAGVSH